jgi:hypothetical protein
VSLHRDLADTEFDSDLLVQVAGYDQRHGLLFAPGERQITLPKLSTPCAKAWSHWTTSRPSTQTISVR